MLPLFIKRVVKYNQIESINGVEFTGKYLLANQPVGTFMSNIDEITPVQIGNITVGTEGFSDGDDDDDRL